MAEVAVTVMSAGVPGAMSAARPQLIRALNEQLLLGHIRDHGPCSRADLARLSGLSKPTVSLALATVEQAGLIREAGAAGSRSWPAWPASCAPRPGWPCRM